MPAIRNAFVEEDEADWHYIEVRGKEEDDQPLSRIDNPTDPVLSH